MKVRQVILPFMVRFADPIVAVWPRKEPVLTHILAPSIDTQQYFILQRE